MIDDFIIGFEDAVGEPVIAHELPDIFDRIEFRAFGWKRDDADSVRYDECVCHMPASLIHEHDGMGIRGYVSGDFGKMQVHCVGIANWQNKPCTFPQGRADRPKDVA